MRFKNLTRATEIGANSYLLEIAGRRIVLDSGMHPKRKGEEALPDFAKIGEPHVDAILISHSHLDHIGSLPVLIRRQPRARVFMSEASMPLTEAILHNSVNVMTRQREDEGIMSYPLFTHREADDMARKWQVCQPGQRWSIDGERIRDSETVDVAFRMYDAGHIMGSTGMMIEGEGRKFFYSGDVNFDDQTISKGATFPEEPVDVMVMETTRGDSPLPAGFTRKAEQARLAQALKEAFARGGSVLMPIFALGKTQEILAMFYQFKRDGILGEVPIYIGGLSTKMTTIYDKLAASVPRNYAGLQLLDTVAPYVIAGRQVDEIPIHKGRIYALSSGMMTENTLSNIFARRFISHPENSLFLVGYSDPESPAGRLVAAAPGDPVHLDPNHPAVPLKCHVDRFNFSAHSDREGIRNYILRVRPKKLLLVHGDVPAIEWFRSTLQPDMPDTEIIVPKSGEMIDL